MVQHFGEASYKNGELNRKHIADIVFNNKEKLDLLNSITHPATIEDANEWIKQQTAPYIIKEAALLFETDAAKHLDYFIGVSAPLAIRLKRVMRNKITESEVMKRISRQMDEVEKMKRCDFIITNNEEEMVIPQVLSTHKNIISY